MKYYLRIPKTKSVAAVSLLPESLQQDSDIYQRTYDMCGLRETMRDKLKIQSKTGDMSRISGVVSGIQNYLTELHWFISLYESRQEEFARLKTMMFVWKSAIITRVTDTISISRPTGGFHFKSSNSGGDNSDGGAGGSGGDMKGKGVGSFKINVKQRRTQSSSIYVELGFTLLALAVAKSMSAYAKVVSLDTEIECETINAMTPGAQIGRGMDEEGEQGAESLKRASYELREASGIFLYISYKVLGHIRGLRLGVPDMTPDMLNTLQTLSLADSDRLSVRVWLRTDKNLRKTPNTPANLLLGIQERYANAYTSLRTMQGGEFRSASSEFQNYMREGQLVILAQAMVYLAQVQSDSQKYGNAVGFIREARDILEGVKKRSQSVHAETAKSLLDGPLLPLYSLYRRNNDTIGFEPVPSSDEIHAKLPSGRALISTTVQYKEK